MQRVAVATDRSETAQRAEDWAAAMADRYGAELVVIQVLVPQNAPGTEAGQAEATRASFAAAELTQRAEELAGTRGSARVVIDDDPATSIVRAAESGADVLVVGNAGMSGRKEFLLGNVPNRISHNARCTVVIVNTTSADGKVSATVTRPAPRAGSASETEGEEAPPLIGRAAQIGAVMAKHGLKALFGKPGPGEAPMRARARNLRAALEELGPTFCKLGQILSTRPDLVPPEFIEDLSTLQDSVPPLTEQQVVQVMEEELGVPWEDVFQSIDPKPLAMGHRTGAPPRSPAARVVVKVSGRPRARRSCATSVCSSSSPSGRPSACVQAGRRHEAPSSSTCPNRYSASSTSARRRPTSTGCAASSSRTAPGRPGRLHGLLDDPAAGDAGDRGRADPRCARGSGTQGGGAPDARVVLPPDHGGRLLPRRSAPGQPDVVAR
jgi:nucleotide-binding universal stress UspA family protein